MQKIKKINVKLIPKDKIYNNHVEFKIEKLKNIYIRKISMHFTNQFFI